jgi:DNA-binding NtrC family response regulator
MRKPVLIVDDEEDIRDTCRDAFELQGYRVEVAENGCRALALLEAIEPVWCCSTFSCQVSMASRSSSRCGRT